MKEETLTERMDQYLLGKMSEAERLAFEAEMEQDPALAQTVADHWQAISAIRRAAVAPLFNKAKAQQQGGNSRSLWIGLSVAASIALLAVAGWNRWWPFPANEPSTFAAVYSPPKYPPATLGPEPYPNLRASWQAFRFAQLDSAIFLAQERQLEEGEQALGALWRGIYRFEQYREGGQLSLIEHAIPDLTSAHELGTAALQARAAWYLALGSHMLGDQAAAEEWIALAASDDTHISPQQYDTLRKAILSP